MIIAKQKTEMLDDAQRKAQEIIKNAEIQAHKTKQELEDNREHSVKQASKIVIKKMI